MGGTPGPDSSAGPGRTRVQRFVIVAVVVAALVLASASFYLLTRSPPATAANTPPYNLGIFVSPSSGNSETTFAFTAQVSDEQDPASALQVRWDWENDNTWDTTWSTNKSRTHVFAQPGGYTVRVEARDTGDLTANATRQVSVLPPPLRIGTIFSTTGALSVFGVSQQNAVDMAVDEINAAGGVLGQPIQVFHMDDQTNPTVAGQDAASLIMTDHVVAIIGATASSMCAAVLSIARANNVFEISPSCTSPIFSNFSYTGGWFARTVPSDALQAVVAAYYAYHNLSLLQAATVGINNAYGTGVANAFAGNFTRLGGTVTAGSPRYLTEVQFGATDYTADLEAVLDVTPAPQVLYVAAYPPDGILLAKNFVAGQATHPGWANVRLLFSEGVFDQASFIDPLVSAGVDVSGFQGTSPAVYAGVEPPGYAAWAAQYQARYGTAPSLFAANSYDATYLVALAAEAAGAATGAAIRAKFRSVANPAGTLVGPHEWARALQEFSAGHDVNYDGVSGPVNMNAFGDVFAPYVIWAIDSSNRLYTKEFFDESVVVALLPVFTSLGSKGVVAMPPRLEPA